MHVSESTSLVSRDSSLSWAKNWHATLTFLASVESGGRGGGEVVWEGEKGTL